MKEVLVGSFNSIAEGELAKNLLLGHGIKCLFQKRGLEFPGDLGDSYGADLFVLEKDAQKAKKVMDSIGKGRKTN
ncbi:MAG: hypothetical protein NTW60_00105 [Candidatus Wolfebacteria bacterium]|nr:hypothetical protein [Candidatus Wolfebacteria bacterium]